MIVHVVCYDKITDNAYLSSHTRPGLLYCRTHISQLPVMFILVVPPGEFMRIKPSFDARSTGH